jgi:hypothetical protein
LQGISKIHFDSSHTDDSTEAAMQSANFTLVSKTIPQFTDPPIFQKLCTYSFKINKSGITLFSADAENVY